MTAANVIGPVGTRVIDFTPQRITVTIAPAPSPTPDPHAAAHATARHCPPGTPLVVAAAGAAGRYRRAHPAPDALAGQPVAGAFPVTRIWAVHRHLLHDLL